MLFAQSDQAFLEPAYRIDGYCNQNSNQTVLHIYLCKAYIKLDTSCGSSTRQPTHM